MKRLIPLLLIFLFSMSNAFSIEKIYWKPENPEPGDDITVYVEIDGNASSVILQWCIGDLCFFPSMEKNGDVWQTVIPGDKVSKGTIELNVTAENSEKVFKNAEITVKEKNTPGFELFFAFIAIALISIKVRKRL
ncbi:MAG TPA: hypothetical protein ENI33_06640 [Thermoplasmatales archaeon]|nr:hypothetical protein [Thermoplasmatales archaeon]